VLGDSIAFGLGASRPEDTLAPRLCRALSDDGIPVVAQVFAASGARSADLGRQVDRALRWAPDVAVLVVGANDLTHLVPTDQAVADLGAALRRLRTAGCEVVVAPAPDLSAVPRVPPAMRDAVRRASERLRRAQVGVAEAHGARVADADGGTARAFAADRALFSADRFHPSSTGYAAIARALLPHVRAACQEACQDAGPDAGSAPGRAAANGERGTG